MEQVGLKQSFPLILKKVLLQLSQKESRWCSHDYWFTLKDPDVFYELHPLFLVNMGAVKQIFYHCWFSFLCSVILSFIRLGKPTCRCPVGFSGPFCERRICDNYCMNGGTCDVTQGNQPVCRCMAEYTGERCLHRESNQLQARPNDYYLATWPLRDWY